VIRCLGNCCLFALPRYVTGVTGCAYHQRTSSHPCNKRKIHLNAQGFRTPVSDALGQSIQAQSEIETTRGVVSTAHVLRRSCARSSVLFKPLLRSNIFVLPSVSMNVAFHFTHLQCTACTHSEQALAPALPACVATQGCSGHERFRAFWRGYTHCATHDDICVHRRCQGWLPGMAKGAMLPPKFLEYIVILCFERRYPKQKCFSPKIKHFDPSKFLCCLRCCLRLR